MNDEGFGAEREKEREIKNLLIVREVKKREK